MYPVILMGILVKKLLALPLAVMIPGFESDLNIVLGFPVKYN